jgi:hypothetical protein
VFRSVGCSDEAEVYRRCLGRRMSFALVPVFTIKSIEPKNESDSQLMANAGIIIAHFCGKLDMYRRLCVIATEGFFISVYPD